jgi:histidine triad (HIT) family protein
LPSPREGCLFCEIVADGAYVAKTEGFVAIDDINPQAEKHILIIPERHLDTFRDIAELEPDEAKRMLDFIAEVAREAGLHDYQVIANVGRSAGQTVFHLHWHVIGDTSSHLEAATMAAVREL